MAAALSWLLHSACQVLPYPKVSSTASKNISKNGGHEVLKKEVSSMARDCCAEFQMPLHYPPHTKADYEKMEEWRLDLLLKQYGIAFQGTLDQKRASAIGTFLWPDQY